MSARLPRTVNPFSGRLMAGFALLGIISFIAIFALLGWAPDIASKGRAGSHPYSVSALGHSGLITLLEADGQTVEISRLPRTLREHENLVIAQIPRSGFRRSDSFDLRDVYGKVLFILPKWSGMGDREKPSWFKDTNLISAGQVSRIFKTFDRDGLIHRLRNPGELETVAGRFKPDFSQSLQVMDSNSLVPIITMPGGILLGQLPGRDVYVLSDPDLMNTFGLSSQENARMALSLIDWLKETPGEPITFDATLHGFERSEKLLRAIFDRPFIGATAIGLATILLLGWSAFVRLAPPVREARAIAFGKQGLAESSAGLIAMARREGQMAERYAITIRRAAIRRLGLPTSLKEEELARTLDTLSQQRALTRDWSSASTPLKIPAKSREDLTQKARQLWAWRKEMMDEH